jgi:hypothetical protein
LLQDDYGKKKVVDCHVCDNQNNYIKELYLMREARRNGILPSPSLKN